MHNIIVLSSAQFLFRFLPLFLIVYYITPEQFRNAVLFMGSIVFYAAGQPKAVLVLLALTVLNWYTGNAVFSENVKIVRGRADEKTPVRKRRYLIAAVSIDAAVLVAAKVLALKVNSAFLPVGMSFYIFKMISYQADMYHEVIRQRPWFTTAAAYFTMFPQVTQGPISRYNDGFTRRGEVGREYSLDRFEDGLINVIIGLSMKILLADRIGILWNEITKIGYDSISTLLAWMGAYGYTFQLFFDFWGYSLIAAGVTQMLGMNFVLNFNHPYAAKGIGDFYRRWHATLGNWFRDYIYIPMGGSRVGTAKTIRNLLVVWLITGFWHGGTVNFILWGLVLGLFIVLEKFVLKGAMQKVPAIGHLAVWIIIPLTWVIFAITDLKSLGLYFTRLFPLGGSSGNVNPEDYIHYARIYWPFFAASVVLCIPKVMELIQKYRKSVVMTVVFAVLFWVAMYYGVNSSANAFMYFSF